MKSDTLEKILELQKSYPDVIVVKSGKNIFSVLDPNRNDITTSASGKSPWFFIRAIKSSRKHLNFLVLNHVLWGLEISQGKRLQRSVSDHGKEKVLKYISRKIQSIFFDPSKNWKEIQFFHIY